MLRPLCVIVPALLGGVLFCAAGVCAGEQRLYPEMAPPFHEFVTGGKAQADIVVLDPSSGTAAAKDLQRHLEMISGATLALCSSLEQSAQKLHFVLGTSEALERAGIDLDLPALGNDGFCIRSQDGRVLLVGDTELSQCYAASTFLEKYLDVRWFYPDEVGRYVPRTKTVRIGRIHDVETPDFDIRMVGKGGWALRNKSNTWVEKEGEQVVGRHAAHNFRKYLPSDKYYDEHPEYYPLWNGQRLRPEATGQVRVQICTSNPEVIAEVAKNICEELDGLPERALIYLCPEDGEKFCQCPDCLALDEKGATKQGKYSRRVLVFVNAVADIVKRTHPHALIATYAYWQYVAPPFDTRLEPRDNVLVLFCHSYCHNHALNDPECKYNRDLFNKYLNGWRQAANLGVYEYYYKVIWMGMFWPIVHSIREDIPHYKQLGCRLFYTQWDNGADISAAGLDYYVTTKLLWDTTMDVDSLLEDFYEKAYGKAREPMKRFHESLERAMVDSRVHVAVLSRPYAAYLRVFNGGVMRELRECLDEADALAEDRLVKERLKIQRLGYDYTQAVVTDYLTPMKALAARKKPLWFGMMDALFPEAEKIAAQHVPKIEEAIMTASQGRAIGDYTSYFLKKYPDAHLVLEGVGRYFAGPDRVDGGLAPVLDKRSWLDKQAGAGRTEGGPRPETFSLWVYGNDFDSSEEAAEHTLQLARKDGKLDLREVAPRGEPRNNANWCCVYRGMRFSDYPEDVLSLTITNPFGKWSMSRFFAVYVMPGELALSDEEATRRIEKDIEWVRRTSVGFIEFAYDGYESEEGSEDTFDIPLAFDAR